MERHIETPRLFGFDDDALRSGLLKAGRFHGDGVTARRQLVDPIKALVTSDRIVRDPGGFVRDGDFSADDRRAIWIHHSSLDAGLELGFRFGREKSCGGQ